MADRRDALALLKEYGFEFEREARHGEFWANPKYGRILLSNTFQDTRSYKNWLGDFKRLTGYNPYVLKKSEAPKPDKLAEFTTKFIETCQRAEKPLIKEELLMPASNIPTQHTKKAVVPEIVLNIITAPELTDQQKIGMLLGFGQFPETVLKILGAGDLSMGQKVAMFTGYMNA